MSFIRSSCCLFRRQATQVYCFSTCVRYSSPLQPTSARVPPEIPTRNKQGLPKKRRIPNVKHVVAVSSGKGGVGKSTVAVNLALALSQTKAEHLDSPLKVGLLDLDVFGPSIPKLMALEDAGDPQISEKNELVPMQNYGIQCMSIGFLLPQKSDTAVVWRGLMVMKAVQQLLFDVDWASPLKQELDILVVDMPPGTGDVQLSLSQLVHVDGSVIVSTPQDVALIDVRKGISMFEKVNVPILGTVLNMSHFVCSNCSEPHYVFGSPQAFEHVSSESGASVLARIPLEPALSELADQGKPAVVSCRTSSAAREFTQLAREIYQRLVK